jgi:hypothetical protein
VGINFWQKPQRLESIYQQKIAALDDLKKTLPHTRLSAACFKLQCLSGRIELSLS